VPVGAADIISVAAAVVVVVAVVAVVFVVVVAVVAVVVVAVVAAAVVAAADCASETPVWVALDYLIEAGSGSVTQAGRVAVRRLAPLGTWGSAR
jgi:hypothetical protein